MDYYTAFLLGFIGSLHCAGMCGPLMLALPNPARGPFPFAISRLAYNGGRLTTYSLLGVIFGLIGHAISISGLQRWLSIGLGIILVAGLVASRWVRFSMPISRVVNQLKNLMAIFLRRRSIGSLAVLGMLNGLLPCGLVYVASAGAAATGSGLTGGAYMAAFGAGTLPMMLGIGLSSQIIPFALKLRLQKSVPVSVFLLGVVLILRGMSLGVPYLSPDLSHGGSCCH